MSDIKNTYIKLREHLNTIDLQKEIVKERMDSLREKIANVYDLRDKKEKIDLKKVKAGLLKKSIEFSRVGKNNLENDLDTMLKYAQTIKEKKLPSSDIDLFLIAEEELKNFKKDFNLYKKEALGDMDVIDYQALIMIITEELSRKGDSAYKNNEELLEKIKEIKKIIKF